MNSYTFININSIEEHNFIQKYYLKNGYEWITSGKIFKEYSNIYNMLIDEQSKKLSNTEYDEIIAYNMYNIDKTIVAKQLIRKIKLNNLYEEL